MKRSYKQLACFHASLILDDALSNGCTFGLVTPGADLDPAEQAAVDGISGAMMEIISELAARGARGLSSAAMVERERKLMRKKVQHERPV